MIRNLRDLSAGLLLAAFGTFFLIYALQYPIGTVNLMGPGFFPLCISIGLIALGLVIAVKNIHDDNLVAYSVRDSAAVLSSIAAFVFITPYTGWVISLSLLITATALLHKKSTVKNIAIVVAIGIFILLCFKYLLRVPIELWTF